MPGETGHWAEVVRKAPSALKYCQDTASLTPQAAPILPPFFLFLFSLSLWSKLIIKQLNIKGRLGEPWNLFRKPVRKLLRR